MKFLFATVSVFLLSSCLTDQFKTGQRFVDGSPDFYLSIAPSFGTPYEYEIISGEIIFREYSGKGGYNWGKTTKVVNMQVSSKQQEQIRALAVTAMKDAAAEYQGSDVVVLDGVGWYVLLNYGLGPFFSISTNNPPDSFYRLKEYVESIFTAG